MTDRDRRVPGAVPESRWAMVFQFFLIGACAVLSVLVLLLARENRRLKAELAAPPAGQVPPNVLRVGDCVNPFDLTGEAGEPVHFDFAPGGPRTLLLVFSSDCPACAETLPIWNRLLADGATEGVRVVGVETPRGAPEAVALASQIRPLAAPVFTPVSPGPGILSRLPWVPATVLLSGDGLVAQVWFGVLTPTQAEDLRRELATAADAPEGRCPAAS